MFSVKKMAGLLKVSTSGYYEWKKRKPSRRSLEDLMYIHDIYELFAASKRSAGSRMIAKQLGRLYGHAVSRKRVARLMREYGLSAKQKKRHIVTTDSDHDGKIFPNLLKREFKADAPNQKMVSDTTYIWTSEGWLYLSAVKDLYGRKIVGMAVSCSNDHKLVIAALQDAAGRIGEARLEGCVLHSDRGSTYASREYKEELVSYGMKGSMSRKGNCWDNAPMESFWWKMKTEWIDHVYESREEAITDVYEYIWAYYNRMRPHSTNDYRTPEEYYAQLTTA